MMMAFCVCVRERMSVCVCEISEIMFGKVSAKGAHPEV